MIQRKNLLRMIQGSALLIFSLLFLALVSPSAYALGIAPSRIIIPYSPGNHTVEFRIINDDHATETLSIAAGGELGEYATLDSSSLSITAEQREIPVRYTIDLPAEADVHSLEPGQRNLDISVTERAENGGSSQGAAVGVGLALTHQLKVDVPYPGTYAEGLLFIVQQTVQSPITFSVALYNKGSVPFTAEGTVVMKDPSDPANATIGGVFLSSATLRPGGQAKLEGTLDRRAPPGAYEAQALIKYAGKNLLLEEQFSVGKWLVNITTINVSDFKLGSIAKFDIALSNDWNLPANITADVAISDRSGRAIAQPLPTTLLIRRYANSTLNVFWDTTGLSPGYYSLKLRLAYADKAPEYLYYLNVSANTIMISQQPPPESIAQGFALSAAETTTIVIASLIVIVLLNGVWLFFIRRAKKR